MADNPIQQFEIHPMLSFDIAGWDASFTNASLAMAASRLVAFWLV